MAHINRLNPVWGGAAESAREEAGFEPSVRGRPPASLEASAIVRTVFSVSGIKQSRDEPSRKWLVSRGTDGSNPASSSGESGELPTRVGYQAQDLCFQTGGVGCSVPPPGSLAPLRKSGIQGTRAIVRGRRPPCAT